MDLDDIEQIVVEEWLDENCLQYADEIFIISFDWILLNVSMKFDEIHDHLWIPIFNYDWGYQ